MSKNNVFDLGPDWLQIQTIDMHTAGEPLRVITSGYPLFRNQSVLEIRRHLREELDDIRNAVMLEPRGHDDMYGALIVGSDQADFGVVFMHNEGYSTMCGHATIALGKLAIQAGWVKKMEPITRLTIEAPCGILEVEVDVQGDNPGSVRFKNVPSFVVSLDNRLDVERFGDVSYDLAFGGAYYAFVNADDFGLECIPENVQKFIDIGRSLKKTISNETPIDHPAIKELGFLYGVIFIDYPAKKGVFSRNVCVFADGQVDRSPTGSGVSARLAIHKERGEIEVGEWITIESVLGTSFRCRIERMEKYFNMEAVIPEVEGEAYVTGAGTLLVDPDDPLKYGFTLRS